MKQSVHYNGNKVFSPNERQLFYTSKQTVLCVETSGYIGGNKKKAVFSCLFLISLRHFFSL